MYFPRGAFTVLSIAAVCSPAHAALEREVFQTFDDAPDGEPPPGWTVGNTGGPLGNWMVESGELSIQGAGTGTTGNANAEDWIWFDRNLYGDIAIEFRLWWPARPTTATDVGRHGGICFFATFSGVRGSRYDGMSGYTLDWIDRASDLGIRFHKWINGVESGTLFPDLFFTGIEPPELWRIEVKGDTMSVIVDDVFFQEAIDPDFRSGLIGFWQYSNNAHAHYDDLVITNPDLVVIRDLPDALRNGGSDTARITVLPYLPGTVTVTETVPALLTASSPSSGGILTADMITWDLGLIDDTVELTYTLAADLDARDAPFVGSATHEGNPFPVLGDIEYRGAPFNSMGFIKLWNHLGPLAWAYPPAAGDHGSPGACDAADPSDGVAGSAFALDWIIDETGDVTEATILPFPGLVVRPAYGGDGRIPGTGARAAGLTVGPGDTGTVAQDRFPAWKAGFSASGTVEHVSDQVHGFGADDQVTMSCIFITNNAGKPIDTSIGLASDDSIQVFLNDVEVTAGSFPVCRGYGAANTDLDTYMVTIRDEPKESRLLVKVASGASPSGFRLRFQDPANQTLPGLATFPGMMLPELGISLESELNPRVGRVVRSLAKDTIETGEAVEVTLTASADPPENLVVREVLPPGASASAITDGGTRDGSAIVWNLQAVSTKTIGYKISLTDPCEGGIDLVRSSYQAGLNEITIDGPTHLERTFREDALGSWRSLDIGTTGGAHERMGDHGLSVLGRGNGVKLLSDSFRFISVPANGDFEISAGIDCVVDPAATGCAGVMVRASEDADAAMVFVYVKGAILQAYYRHGTGKTAINITLGDRDVPALPVYLKLVRTGTKISIKRSENGTDFREIASRDIGAGTTQVDLADATRIGLAITAGGSGSIRTSFSKVSGPSFGGDIVSGFRRGDADDSGKLDLTDAIATLQFLYMGYAAPACKDAADTDDSGTLDLTDAISSLQFQFMGGTAPASPGPVNCGPDPTTDDQYTECTYTNC
jgi:hypothetical protein